MKKSIGRFRVGLADMKAGRAWLLAFGLLMVAWPGSSQTTGSIEGRVLDGESRPLAGTLVTVRSPSLQGTRTATTDRDGRFLIQGLPPGDYAARAEFTSLPPVEQTGVPVAVDSSRTLEFRVLPRFREEVEVAGEPPILDATSSATTTIVERTVFKELPTSRTFLDLSYLAPGAVKASGFFRGQAIAQPGYPSINGASLAENRYLVEGLDVTDPRNGTLESTLPVDFLEQVDIKTGSFAPEYGGALGGILNVVTRSGSNELHGSVFGYYKDDGLKSDPPANVRNVRLLGTKEYEAGATVGGRIIRDRLWYFVGIDPTFRDQEWMTQQAFRVTNESDTTYYTVKLTGQLHPSHQLVASAFGDPTEGTAFSLDTAGILRDDSNRQTNHFVLAYHGVPSSRLWLEARAGHYGESDVVEPAGDREDQEFYLDFTGGRWAGAENCGDPSLLGTFVQFAPGCLGGTWSQSKDDGTRNEARAAATAQWKTGRVDHDVKAGGSWRQSRYETDGHWPGAVEGPFRDRHGNVLNPEGVSGHIWLLFDDFAELIDVDLNDSRSESEEVAFFLQDRVRVSDRLTLDLGIRTERFESTGDRTSTDPTLRLKFGFEDMIAPRLGVAWDPFGKGRSRLFAHYGRSYESVPLAFNSLAFLLDDSWLYDFEYPADGSLPSVGNLGELIAYFPIGVGPTQVATDLKPMYSDSYALGFEYQIGSELAVGLTGIYREVGDTIDDLCIGTCFLGNPGGVYRVDPVTGAALPTPIIVPEPVREYRALQLTFQKRLADRWQVFGNYVYSKLEGNYGGAIHEATRFLNPHFTEAPEILPNTFGFLPNDRTHQAKLYGSYEWSFGLTSGLVAQFFTGTPASKRGAIPGFGGAGGRFITRRGSEGRTPDIYMIDLHLAYSIPIGKVLSLSLFGDLFNVTDAQRGISVDEIWTNARKERTEDPNECGGPGTGPGTDCPLGNPNWGGPLTFQDPRTLRLGARLSF